MNLESRLDARLWDSIRASYESRDFRTAIIDAIHFLGQLIRDKSGLEGDGQNLVGAAFGGKTPVLKVNPLQTESDWNLQRGVEQLLRGLYLGIRNPRSHSKLEDRAEDAVAIILFVNYLVRLIDGSRSPFVKNEYIRRVFDPSFPKNRRFAELLVDEVPTGQRFNILIEVYRDRMNGDGQKLAYFFDEMLKRVDHEEAARFMEVVSEEMKTVANEAEIRHLRQCLPSRLWPQLSEIARLRVENILIESVRQGRYSASLKKCLAGSSGTWLNGILEHVTLKQELLNAICGKIRSDDKGEREYAIQFFLPYLYDWLPNGNALLKHTITSQLEKGDANLMAALDFVDSEYTPEWWRIAFKQARTDFKTGEPDDFDPGISDDDIPF